MAHGPVREYGWQRERPDMLWLCLRLPALQREALAASEREALERLAAWAYQWSSLVSYRPSDAGGDPLLWLELAGSRSLFGEPAALLARLSRQLLQLGYHHAAAIAPSPTAAALLTRLPEPPCLLTPAQLQARLAPLPLQWLELPADTLGALRCAGLRWIGEVLRVPAAALARRFGPSCCDYLQRLRGTASDPLPAFQLPSTYRARCQFDYELQDTTALLFPLQRLLQEFQGYLRARDRAVQRFTLELEHPRAGAQHPPLTTLCINLSIASREAARFLVLSRERLQPLVLEAPVCAVTLRAEAFSAPTIVQTDLFGSEQQQLGELAPLLDRLRARLGEQAVQTLQLHADHRPERAFQCVRAQAGSTRAVVPNPPVAARPAALLPAAQPIEPPGCLLEGPERIESGWWDGGDVRRDYYVARDAQGARHWVFQDLREDRWYLQGWWV